jgi:hypothetical protein
METSTKMFCNTCNKQNGINTEKIDKDEYFVMIRHMILLYEDVNQDDGGHGDQEEE